MQKFSLLKRRPVRHRAEYDRLYLTRDQQCPALTRSPIGSIRGPAPHESIGATGGLVV